MTTVLPFVFLPRRWRWLRRLLTLIVAVPFAFVVMWVYSMLGLWEGAEVAAEAMRACWAGLRRKRNRVGATLLILDGDEPSPEEREP